MQASFTERSIWIQLVSLVVAFGGYFLVAWQMLAAGVDRLAGFVPLFAAAVVFLVVMQVFGHTLAAIVGRTEGPDERDRIIEWRSESNSSWILGVGVLGAISAMVVELPAVWVAHGLFASLFLSQLAQYVFQLIYYRRGMRGFGGV